MLNNNDGSGGRNTQPHDRFFRAAFSQPQVLAEFLETQLPPYLLELIDLNKIEILPANFISLANAKLDADLICKAPFVGEDNYMVFLIEHQSTVVPNMAFRIWRYTCEIMQQHLNLYGKLPFVIAMVLYNGTAKYNQATDVKELINVPRRCLEDFNLQKYKLIDLNHYDATSWADKISWWLISLALQHAYATDRASLSKMMQSMDKITKLGKEQLVKIVLEYVLRDCKFSKTDALLEDIEIWLSQPFREATMSLAQALRDEGEQIGIFKGKIEGKREMAVKMLQFGAAINLIQATTELPLAEIVALQQQLSTATQQ